MDWEQTDRKPLGVFKLADNDFLAHEVFVVIVKRKGAREETVEDDAEGPDIYLCARS